MLRSPQPRRPRPRQPEPDVVLAPDPFKPQQWPEPGKMHFRLYEDSLGSLDLSCENGYVVQAYDLGFPEERSVAENNSLDDGTYDTTQFFGARSISLDLLLKPHTGTGPASEHIGAEAKLRDHLLAYTYPGIRPRLYFSEHQDDRIKQALLRGSDASVAVDQRNYNKLSVSWVAPRGALWSWQERCAVFRFDATSPDIQTQTILNAGSIPAYWRARVIGETVKPIFMLDGQTVLALDYNSVQGDIIEIESFSRTVSINGKPIGYKYVEDDSSWFRIPPGEHLLTVQVDYGQLQAYPWGIWQPAGTPTNWAAKPPDNVPPNNPPPQGAPPWAWSTWVDPDTGQPIFLDVDFCWYDTFI